MRWLIMFILAAIAAAGPAQAADRGAVIGYVAAFKGLDRQMRATRA